ncbi:Porphyromonas-type peptidyl-arginine deiminase [Sulfurimonas denitrificans DSM 1251]|uniref:Porphyromonas-type peptidyl-arginine deiminase n=1 Tax=Sulfurimonas denitrificans (strain ATCC 33889 / DSM 1251) TaxID=326298 RepID=Q30TM2_SULDN|nr:agmatine deiminase family protein [Sulfurimonas denitrificans]ABB43659.1 Porphyromonas-type peptidyl-arginine deiminase [Sulfurimonas denitrificans DSM 1251]MDD3442549.1 agmatine deiminase family protein [Sulfurimonas denitrificans]
MKRFIAEFEEQSFTQIIFPHVNSDWVEYLSEAEETFENIIKEIIKYQKCLVVSADVQDVKRRFEPNKNLYFVEYETNDTWARDCSALCIENGSNVELLDFTFTGWGGKFEASKDNVMSKEIAHSYSKKLKTIDLILEGGGVESNGVNTILTTSECMLNKNRNSSLKKEQMTQILKDEFGMSKILYLNHGYLAGDDTDSHVDTLARFVDEKTIMYVKCEDKNDEHYKELKLMEDELKVFAKDEGFKLIALPMSEACYFDNERLPATYANFLFVNGAVLVPIYGVKEDEEALKIFKDTFPTKDIVPINCFTLIKQHGSLHCVTMNFAKGVELI